MRSEASARRDGVTQVGSPTMPRRCVPGPSPRERPQHDAQLHDHGAARGARLEADAFHSRARRPHVR